MILNNKINSLISKYHENKFSHAFLFVTNDINNCQKDLISLIKEINCPHNYRENCEGCYLCYQIENNLLPNLKQVYPDGQFIKKNQILELKEQFKTKPLYLKHNFYLINNAEKLNTSAANTMLKFLEEPEEDIIGFFITNNKETMLETIKSRCQIIIANYDNLDLSSQLGITEEQIDNFQKIAETYLNNIINKKEDGLVLNRTIIFSQIQTRDQVIKFLNYLYLVLSNNINVEHEIIHNFGFNKINQLQKLVYKFLADSYFNVNIELLLDNFVLEMEEII